MTELPTGVENWFTSDTLSVVQREPCPVVVSDLMYFRNGSSARMEEPGGRRFTTFIRLEDGAPSAFQCTCPHRQTTRDMCRHVALLFLSSVEWNDEGEVTRLRAERFEESLWFGVARGIQAGLEDDRLDHEIEDEDGDLAIRTLAIGGIQLEMRVIEPDDRTAAMVLSGFPETDRPDGYALDNAHDGRQALLQRFETTRQEQLFESKGLPPTARQLWESSFWFRLSRALFELLGDDPNALDLEVAEGVFHLSARGNRATVNLKLTDESIEALLQHTAGACLLEGAGFRCLEESATPSLRITLDEDQSLRFTPAILADGQVYSRQEAEKRRLGKWLFIEPIKLFATVEDVPKLFPEHSPEGQAAFAFGTGWQKSHSGMPFERETVVPASEVFDFVARHRNEIRKLNSKLVDDVVRTAVPFVDDAEIDLELMSRTDKGIEADIAWRFGSERVGLTKLLAARKARKQVLILGRKWVPLSHQSFAWIEDLSSESFIGLKKKRLLIRPLDVLRIHASASDVRLSGDETLVAEMAELAALKSAIEGPAAGSLGVPLYPYQETGYRWLWFLQQNGLGGLLCDDMGLGKTHQALALMGSLAEADPSARFLVVCPTSVIDHWRSRIVAFLEGIDVQIYGGGRTGLSRCVVASYGMARNHSSWLAKVKWDVIVLDEIQTIKNRATATYKALAAVPKRVAIGLTGTPIENHVGELRTLLDFVQPGYLPGEAAFERRFAGPIERDEPGVRERLSRLIHPFVLRRSKKQVLTELPDKIVDTRYCELTEEQRELYREVLEGRAKEVKEDLEEGRKVSYLHVFAVLNYLKQVCNHPALFHSELDPERHPSGKWDLFKELLGETLDSGLKVVVFSQYVSMLRLIESHLEKGDVGFATIKGSTRDRPAMLRRFAEDPDCRVFTASLKAGGVGIDLTAASVVIHYDRWWNQAREDQATDRVHRIGQNRGVQVIKLITRGTLEERIDAMITRKHELAADLVREDDPTLTKQFSRQELRELLAEV